MYAQGNNKILRFLLALFLCGTLLFTTASTGLTFSIPYSGNPSDTDQPDCSVEIGVNGQVTSCTLDQRQTLFDGSVAFGGKTALIQSFTPRFPGAACTAKVKIRRITGLVAGNLKLSILDSAGAVLDYATIAAPPVGDYTAGFNLGCNGGVMAPGLGYRLKLEAPTSAAGAYRWYDKTLNPYKGGSGRDLTHDYTFWEYSCADCPLNVSQPAWTAYGAVPGTQTFRPTLNGPACKVTIKVRRNTSVAGPIKLTLTTMTNVLVDSAQLPAPALGLSAVTFPLGCDGSSLVKGQQYKLTLTAPGSLAGTYNWLDAINNPYAGGSGDNVLHDYNFLFYICPKCALNQSQMLSNGGVTFGGATALQQTFKPTVNGPLCLIQAVVSRSVAAGAGSLRMSVYDAAGALMDSATIPAPPIGITTQTFNMGCDGKFLKAAAIYRMKLESPASVGKLYLWRDKDLNPYPGGTGRDAAHDYAFRVFICDP